ncbi:uncharacterized protein G2W53_004669 [Senna tora]|uniref:Uncharacterized protein n=1 Tax=Senna tora TaxID=362788 RepID=A0A835CIC1_9FABA|nr:uncharacterized protein G2W53_004669 [Senna tora]
MSPLSNLPSLQTLAAFVADVDAPLHHGVSCCSGSAFPFSSSSRSRSPLVVVSDLLHHPLLRLLHHPLLRLLHFPSSSSSPRICFGFLRAQMNERQSETESRIIEQEREREQGKNRLFLPILQNLA